MLLASSDLRPQMLQTSHNHRTREQQQQKKNDHICDAHSTEGEKLCTDCTQYYGQWVPCHQGGRYNMSLPSVLKRGPACSFLIGSYMLKEFWNRPVFLRMKKKGGGGNRKKEKEKEKREGEN